MKKYDLIVAGGGFSGFAAAYSAAREGLSVLLIEKTNALGGASNVNLVMPFMPYRTRVSEGSDEFYMLSRGVLENIVGRMNELGFMNGIYGFNEEGFKIVLNRMAAEVNVELLFGATVTGASRSGGRIENVTVYARGKKLTLEADYFIDATGDANLIALSGFPFRVGREKDSLCQPMTLCFRLAGVDTENFWKEKVKINERYKALKAEGKLRNPREDILVFRTLVPGTLHFNTTRIVKRDPTDPFEVTKAEIEAREQVMETVNFLKENSESCKGAVLLSTAAEIGTRESRMIDGEYLLTGSEIKGCPRFEDSIAVCNYDIDIHNPEGSGTSHYYFPDGKYYEIPYRVLIPRGSENLLVAGRSVSVDHEAQASIRIMPTVCCLGEAAGTAVAVAKKHGTDVRNVDISELQRRLIENGAVIH